jgi:ubiquinone/menaquinone biosynthesis C-methylase UbiE
VASQNGKGMGVYADYLLPWLLDRAMRQKVLGPYRVRTIGAAEGRVLEMGVGSGLNLPLYGSRVASVVGIEPSPPLLRHARRHVANVTIELLEGTAEMLPLADESIDTVVTTWTLCTIPDPVRALAEARRVLRPDGALLFVEHGRVPEPSVARWQDRIDPLWNRLAGGCHLNRPIDVLIQSVGFRLERLETSRVPGPRTHTFFYHGRAVLR